MKEIDYNMVLVWTVVLGLLFLPLAFVYLGYIEYRIRKNERLNMERNNFRL